MKKIVEITRYIKKEEHGESLNMRFESAKKIEAEIKDVTRQTNSYIGTYYAVIRKSSIFRLMCVISMKYGKEVHYSDLAEEVDKILTDNYHSYNYSNKAIYQIVNQVDCVHVVAEKDPHCADQDITTLYNKGNRKIGQVTTNSSSKIKTIIAFLTQIKHEDNDMTTDVMSFGQTSSDSLYATSILSDSKYDKILERLRIWILYNVYPALLNANKIKSGSYQTMKGGHTGKVEKLTRFYEKNPDILQALSYTNENCNVFNWKHFVNLFVPFYMYHTYNYVPEVYQKNSRQRAIISPINFIQMSWDEKNELMNTDTTLVNPAVLDSPAVMMYSRISVINFESKETKQLIWQAKICELTHKTTSLFTDVVALNLMPNMVFAIPIMKPSEWQSNKNTNFLLNLFDELRKSENPIKLIDETAEDVYDFMVRQLYAASTEDILSGGIVIDTDAALEWLGNADPDKTVLSNPVVYEMFANVAKNYLTDKHEYNEQTSNLIKQFTRDDQKADIVEDYDDYDDDDETRVGGEKRKREEYEEKEDMDDDDAWKDP